MIGGIHGTRLLAAIFADIHLRKRGLVAPPREETNGRGWKEGEEDDAMMMRLRGMTSAEISEVTGRSQRAIEYKIFYGPDCHRMGGAR